MLEIDCSHGEGGGQLVRSAIAFSAVLGVPIKLIKIRAGRSKPGLANQHITAIKSVGKLCNGTYDELRIGTSSLEFIPGELQGGSFNFDIGTAGSISLALQACILPAMFCKSEDTIEIRISGGTDVNWSPPIDYMKLVFLKHLQRLGADIELKLITRGYYPKGGGKVILTVRPKQNYNELNFSSRGKLKKISCIVHSRLLPSHIPERISQAAIEEIKNISQPNIRFDTTEKEHGLGIQKSPRSPGTGIVLTADFENTVLGASALGAKGITAERVGASAASGLINELNGNGTVDLYAADQLIPFLAILGGEFTVREISMHTKTNIWLTEQFINKKIKVEDKEKYYKISCK